MLQRSIWVRKMIDALNDIKNLYDEQLNAVRQDAAAMLGKLLEYEAIDGYKIGTDNIYITIDTEKDIEYDTSALEDYSYHERIFIGHQFVMGMYAMYSKCSEQHNIVVEQYRAALNAAEKPKNLIVTPGNSLL